MKISTKRKESTKQITELKNINNWTEKFNREINSKLDDMKERISELKDRAVEFIQSKDQKKNKKSEHILRDL